VAAYTYDLVGPEFFADPDPTLRDMRAHDPVHWHPTLEGWVLTRYDDVRRVLRDSRGFSVDRRGRIRSATPPAMREQLAACYADISRWMIFTDPPAHRRLRTAMAPAFTPGAARRLEAFIRRRVAELLAQAQQRGSIEVVGELAAPLTGEVNAAMLGLPGELVSEVARWSADVFRLFGSGIHTDEVVDAAQRSLADADACVRRLMSADGQARPDGLLARFLKARPPGGTLQEHNDDGTLNDDEVAAAVTMYLMGGHESARHMIGNGLLALLHHPSELAKLSARPGLMDDALEELLRFEGPSVCLLRRATQGVEVGGKHIAKGDFVFCAVRGANRDPAAFADPDRLDVERTGNRHLALGIGDHFCIGAPLARLQVAAALRALISSGPRLADDHAPRWIPSLASRGLHTLPVTLRGPGSSSATDPLV
jgi:cytochrome P450